MSKICRVFGLKGGSYCLAAGPIINETKVARADNPNNLVSNVYPCPIIKRKSSPSSAIETKNLNVIHNPSFQLLALRRKRVSKPNPYI